MTFLEAVRFLNETGLLCRNNGDKVEIRDQQSGALVKRLPPAAVVAFANEKARAFGYASQ